jgi:hypothetical protein
MYLLLELSCVTYVCKNRLAARRRVLKLLLYVVGVAHLKYHLYRTYPST